MELVIQRRLQICFVAVLSMLDGITDGFFGPTLEELQCILGTSLQNVSLLQPLHNGVKIGGCFLYLLIRGRVNIYTIAVSFTTVACILFAMLPLMPSFWLGLLVTVGMGLALGVALHARTILTGEFGKEGAQYVHIINVAICVGNAIGPLIISPFLRGTSKCGGNTTSCYGSASQDNITDSGNDLPHTFRSNIIYGFLIIAVVGLLVQLAFMAFQKMLRDGATQPPHNIQKPRDITKFDILFFVTFTILLTVGGPMNFVYQQYLPIFGIQSSLNAAPRLMATMSFSFGAVAVVGRLVGGLLSLFMKSTVLLVVCSISIVLVSVVLTHTSETSMVSLWVGTSLLALVYAPYYPAVLAWSLDVNEHSTILCCILAISDIAGYSLMALVTGQLMTVFFVQVLNYILTASSVLKCVVFLVLYMTARASKKEMARNGYSHIGNQ